MKVKKLTDAFLEDLWKKLGDIPITNDGKIDTAFHIWKKGTHRFAIWHWFDERHSLGVVRGLMTYV